MFNNPRLFLLFADFLVLLAITVQPLSRRYDDSDQGFGTTVKLPKLRQQSASRGLMFIVVGALVALPIVSMHNPSLAQMYSDSVQQAVQWITGDPAGSHLYAIKLIPLLPAAISGFLITMALMIPGTFGRRIMILLHIPIYVLMSMMFDIFMGVVVLQYHFSISPTPAINLFLQGSVIYTLIFRLSFTSFQLPRLSPAPRVKRSPRDSIVAAVCLLSSGAIVTGLVLWMLPTKGNHPVAVFLIIYSLRYSVIYLGYVLLGVVKKSGGKLPRPQDYPTPLINVIIPAYNEEVVIERLLRSIDRAAANYGGPVHVVMCDDGSTDGTEAIAESTIASFQFASGEVVVGAHAGKSAALNTALEYCTADYVYRVDADCALDRDAFVYSVPHFLSDERIGLVGAFTTPKEPYTTWIDRMRLYEQVIAFGFVRVVLSEVDAIPCIPGTFMAFRRDAAVAAGGFVSGMLGEDTEFTCTVARLGYRAITDLRIRSYEDVPPRIKDLRVQRWRWDIGGMLCYGRFTPVGAGRNQGPRFWFKMPQTASTRISAPAHICAWTMALVFAAVQPSVIHDWLHLVLVFMATQALAAVPRLIALIYFKRFREILWFPLWIPFTLIKTFVMLEALLCIPPRPVKPPVWMRARYPTWRSVLAAMVLRVSRP